MTHHYDADAPCPLLFVEVGGVHINDVIELLGLMKQDQPSGDNAYCYLLRQDITDFPELQDYKIPLDEIPQQFLDIGPDPSLFTLSEIRTIRLLPFWSNQVPA